MRSVLSEREKRESALKILAPLRVAIVDQFSKLQGSDVVTWCVRNWGWFRFLRGGVKFNANLRRTYLDSRTGSALKTDPI